MKRVLVNSAGAALLVLGLGFAAAIPARSAAGRENKSSAQVQIKITNFTFEPATLTVAPGTTVTWINEDDIPHTVVSTDGKGIKSAVLDTDEKFQFTFAHAGTYVYYCSVHPRMVGKVIVK